MARGWAYFIAIAAFAALTVDVRGNGIDDAGTITNDPACGACYMPSEEPGLPPPNTSLSDNTAAWTGIDVARGNDFRANVLHSQEEEEEDELSAPTNLGKWGQ